MADVDRCSLMRKNDGSSCEEESFSKQIVNEDIRNSFFNNEKFENYTDSRSSSYHSIYSTSPLESESNTIFNEMDTELNDSSWSSNLLRAASLKNSGSNCDLCKMKNLQNSGNFYCRYCDKCFCESCISFHEQLTPEHDVTNLSNPTELSLKDVMPVSTCDKHKLPITLYCDECHVCLCVACWERHHNGDGQKKLTTCPSPISLDLIATETRAQGAALIESLFSFKEQAVNQSKFLDEIMSELTEKSERKCESLWNKLEVLFTSLRHRLALLISQIQSETHCQNSKLQRKSVTWNSYLREVECLQSKLNELLRFANDADLVSAFKDIKSKTDSLDIDKFLPIMEANPIYVEVEYSQDYLDLHRNVPNLVLGKTCLLSGNKLVDTSGQQTTLDPVWNECKTDTGTQCDDSEFMQRNLSHPFLLYEGSFNDQSISYGNLNVEDTDSCKSPVNKNITTNLDYLYNKKDNSTKNDSDVSGNNSYRSIFSTFSDVSSLQSDFDSTSASNVASINRDCDLNEREKIAESEVGSNDTNYFPRQMPVLKVLGQQSLILEKNTYVRGLTITDDEHVFVCDRNSKKVTQFSPEGKLICRCDISGIAWDLCAFSNSVLFVTLPQTSKILLLQRCTGKCLLAVSLAVSTGTKKYVSLTKAITGVLACDHNANVDLLDSKGNVVTSIISSTNQTDYSVSHRICTGKFEDTFWMLNVTSQTLSCHRLDSELLIYHRITFDEDMTSDICSDCYNCIYGCDKKRIYSLTSEGGENILWTFKQELKNHPRMCVNSTQDKLFVIYQLGNKNVLQIFTISPKFLLANNN